MAWRASASTSPSTSSRSKGAPAGGLTFERTPWDSRWMRSSSPRPWGTWMTFWPPTGNTFSSSMLSSCMGSLLTGSGSSWRPPGPAACRRCAGNGVRPASPARPASLGGEVGEEVLEVLLLGVLLGLQLLDVGLELLDLRLLVFELLQIPPGRRRGRRHLLEVGAQPALVGDDDVELPLLLVDLALGLLQFPPQRLRLLQPRLELVAGDGLLNQDANLLV